MKIDHIGVDEIEAAAKSISKKISPSDYPHSLYWVTVKNQQYPFKYLIRIAHQQTDGNENEWLAFNSKPIYRQYIENLGFEISSSLEEVPFFLKSDIEGLSAIGGSPYQPQNEEHKKIIEDLKNSVWKKTQYWHRRVLLELEGFRGNLRKVWSQRGMDNGKHVSAFKHYTWAKIFREAEIDKCIFFTVGADGASEALVFKLDYKFDDSSELTAEQKGLCKTMIKDSAAGWSEIPIDELHKYDWDKLVEATLAFIDTHIDLYDKVIEETWSINQKRIARLTFNTNGWIMPSGPYGKSTDPDSHEGRNGYGHEEWLCDISKLLNGYHYGFLEPIRKQQNAYEGRVYDIWLYTIDGVSKKRYWVGELLNVLVLTAEDAEKAKKEYLKLNWLQEMEDQIKASGANNHGFSNWKGVDLFNVRFLPSDIKLNDPYFELPPESIINDYSRYSFAHFKEELSLSTSIEDTFEFISINDGKSLADTESIKTKTYVREQRAMEITYFHNAISIRLTNKLKAIYGSANVTSEHPAGYGANRIDIVVNDKDGLIFYEIKTYISVKTSIREALGQLIEYSSWTNHIKAKELIIVTQHHSELDEAKKYVTHLRTIFNIPLYYQYFDLDNNFLSEKF